MMMLSNPLLLVTFLVGLAAAFLIARGIRRMIDRRRVQNFVPGPDTRSRQVKRAHRRQAQKIDR